MKSELTISVVMATYNGERFLKDQLASIFRQSHKPDELIIVDDLSSDSTIKICIDFIREFEADGWRVYKNEVNKGVLKSFILGTKIAKGDIILFADQDDLWEPNKIEEIFKCLWDNPKIHSLTTTFSRFNNNGLLDHHVAHPNRQKNGLKKLSLNEFCSFPNYLGMSMAIRKELLSFLDYGKLEQVSDRSITHDLILNFTAATENGLYHLDKVLTKRRVYIESTSNALILGELEQNRCCSEREYHLEKKILLLSFFIGLVSNRNETVDNTVKKIVKRHISVCQSRLEYLSSNSIWRFVMSIFFIWPNMRLSSIIGDVSQIVRVNAKFVWRIK